MHRVALIGLLVASAVGAAPVPKALKKPPALDGRWQAVSMNQGGNNIMSAHPKVWDIGGGTIARYYAGTDGTLTPENLTITISAPDPAHPDEIDYVQVVGQRKTLYRARIRVTADELVIRFAEMDAPCPADMTEGTDGWLYRFKRVVSK